MNEVPLISALLPEICTLPAETELEQFVMFELTKLESLPAIYIAPATSEIEALKRELLIKTELPSTYIAPARLGAVQFSKVQLSTFV